MSSQQVASCPAWTIPGFLEVRDGHLNINGADVLALVREFASPLFVFSAPRIAANIDRLQCAAAAVDLEKRNIPFALVGNIGKLVGGMHPDRGG